MTFDHSINPWPARIRLVLLLVLLTLGLGIGALEKWRQEEYTRIWSRIYGVLTHVLNPIGEKTNQTLRVALRANRLWVVEDENKRLLRDLSELQVKNQMLTEEMGRLDRLSGLGHWIGPAELRFVSCDVIGLITHEQSAALLINRGRAEGVRPRDPVVALGGLVGVVQSVSAHSSRVQAITDPLSAVGALDRESRSRGIVYGRGRNMPLAFTPENEVQPIKSSAVLITSGFENSVFPKGIVIGMIQNRKLDQYGIPYGVVKPAVSFESLEEVLLVIPRNRTATNDQPTSPPMGNYAITMPLTKSEDAPGTQPLTAAGDRVDTSTTRLVTVEPPLVPVRTQVAHEPESDNQDAEAPADEEPAPEREKAQEERRSADDEQSMQDENPTPEDFSQD